MGSSTVASDLEGVLREVAAGSPVLVFQNLSLPLYPVWHYAVVIGYDRDRNTVIMHSGRTPHMEMSLFAFERTWSRAGQWAMVAVPPAQLPAHASAANYAGALAALERVHPTAAHTSYATALQKWPRERALQLGLGNTAYALGRPDEAVATFRSAVREDPGFADAWNNLAQLLWEQGQHAQAHYAITQAVKIGGPRLQHYTELQTLIHTRASQ